MSGRVVDFPKPAQRRPDELYEVPQLPHDESAEREVLGTLIALEDADLARETAAAVRPQDFYGDFPRRVLEAIYTLAQRQEAPTLSAVAHQLTQAHPDALEMSGGGATVAAFLECQGSPAALKQACARVKESALRRELAEAGRRLVEQAPDYTRSPAELVAALNEQIERVTGEASGVDRFTRAAVSALDFAAERLEKPRLLLGAGVLCAGDFAILYGKSGIGKTWHSLALARALARGAPWLGLGTPPTGACVGFLELELRDHNVQERLHTLAGGADRLDEHDRRVLIIPRDRLRGVVDLRDAAQLEQLKHWIRTHRLEVLIVDALSRAHTANENDAQEFGRVLAGLDALRRETNCAILLLHHERKESRDGSGSENHLDALRGTSRLQSDPTLLMRIHETRGGLRSLVFAKVSTGETPEPIYFRMGPSGPEVVEAPEQVATSNRENVAQVVLGSSVPVTARQVAEALGISKPTANRHLTALVKAGRIAQLGENQAARYTAPTASPSQPSQVDLRDGLADWEATH